MFRTKQELWCTIPNSNNDLVAGEQGLEGFMSESRETEVADFNDTLVSDEDIGGFEVTVNDVCLMEVEETVEELIG